MGWGVNAPEAQGFVQDLLVQDKTVFPAEAKVINLDSVSGELDEDGICDIP
jgi:hypothetical protein